jgi:hypothetical protein
MGLVVIELNPARPCGSKQAAQHFQAIAHHAEPVRMLPAVLELRESAPRIVGRIDIDAFHLLGEFRLERLQRRKIVAKDEPAIEPIPIAPVARCAMPAADLDENASAEARPLLLARPGQRDRLRMLVHCRKGGGGNRH